MEFHVIYRKRKCFGWATIGFNDIAGVSMGGLWYAPLQLIPSRSEPPSNLKQVQRLAKMSTVAIPLSYVLGEEHPHSKKYCVITNWWKERQANGRYIMPGLPPELYVREDNYQPFLSQVAPTVDVVLNNGIETAIV